MRALLLSLLLTGCGTAPAPTPPQHDPGGPIGAAMNDLSILFPLPDGDGDLIAASASGAHGALLPKSLYELVGPISGTTLPNGAGGAGVAEYDDLHVVSMRLDPCFASIAPDPHGVGCTAQVRLTFEEVRHKTTADSALHVFYALTRDEVLLFSRAIVALRQASTSDDLGPLAPHPLMAQQGLNGAFAKGLRALILECADATNITRTALLDSAGPAAIGWTLSAFDISNDGTLPDPVNIPTLANPDPDVQTQAVGQTGFTPFTASLLPATISTDNLLPLDDTIDAPLTTTMLDAAFDGLVRVENPTVHTANDIDCGSCHLATPTVEFASQPLFGLDDRTSALAFVPDAAFVTSAQMAPTIDNNSPHIDLHAFSYDGNTPSINQRVVNETAALVAYLNQLP